MWDDPAIAAVFVPTTLAFVLLGAFLGAVASGGAGFAFALAASAVWLHVLNPVHTAILVLACSTLMQLMTVWPLRPHIRLERLWPFVVGGLIGIPFGVYLLTRTNPVVMKTGLGVFLAVFGLYALIAPRLPLITAGGRTADAAVGVTGGVLGGIGGYSGVIPTIWTQLRGWTKSDARAVYQPYIIVMQIATLAVVGVLEFDRLALVLILITLPMLLLGGWIGWNLYGRLDERMFRKLIAVLLVVSGITLVV